MTKVVFTKYAKLPGGQGALYAGEVELDYADEIASYHDPIRKVEEDFRGRLRVETQSYVYFQEGFMERSHETTT